MLRHPALTMHLVIVGRVDPPMQITRLRAKSQVNELRTQDLQYLALAHTVAGFFQPWNAALEIFAAKLPDRARQIASLHTAMVIAGGAGWFLVTYAGPAVSLLRSPFPHGTNIALGIVYLVVIVALAWVSSQAVRVEAAVSGDEAGLVMSILRELVQPLRW